MTEYVWSELRDPFIDRVGSAPSAAIEQRIIDVFEAHPRLVEQGMEHVGSRFDRGLVRTPWPVLAMHVEETRDSQGKASSVRASDTSGRVKARERGQRWIKSTGIHFDREEEIHDELFGDIGMLREYAHDAELVDELLALWAAERPRGVRAEQEAEDRMRTQGAYYHRRQELERAARKLPLDELPAVGIANPFIEGDA